ncbi:hypothetical protein PMAYCL1PPCAC_01419, partial [Pristionchus mayeri]
KTKRRKRKKGKQKYSSLPMGGSTNQKTSMNKFGFCLYQPRDYNPDFTISYFCNGHPEEERFLERRYINERLKSEVCTGFL